MWQKFPCRNFGAKRTVYIVPLCSGHCVTMTFCDIEVAPFCILQMSYPYFVNCFKMNQAVG